MPTCPKCDKNIQLKPSGEYTYLCPSCGHSWKAKHKTDDAISGTKDTVDDAMRWHIMCSILQKSVKDVTAQLAYQAIRGHVLNGLKADDALEKVLEDFNFKEELKWLRS